MCCIVLSEGTAPSVIEPLANITGRATEQTVLTCKINRGKPDADIKWYAFQMLYSYTTENELF